MLFFCQSSVHCYFICGVNTKHSNPPITMITTSSINNNNNNNNSSNMNGDTPKKKTCCDNFVAGLSAKGHCEEVSNRIALDYMWPENVVVRLRLAHDIDDLRRITAWWHHAYIPHRFETFTARICDQRNVTILLLSHWTCCYCWCSVM